MYSDAMPIFLIVPTTNTHSIDVSVQNLIDSKKRFQLPLGQWLVSYSGTTSQLSDELDITPGKVGTCIVFGVSNYWGFAGKDVWEWLQRYEKD